jgi:hypothetical protein
LKFCLKVNPESTSKILESLEKQVSSDKNDAKSLFEISSALRTVLSVHPETAAKVMNVLEKVCSSDKHNPESLSRAILTLREDVQTDKTQADKALKLVSQMISSDKNDDWSLIYTLDTLQAISQADPTQTDKVAEEMAKILSSNKSGWHPTVGAGRKLALLALDNPKDADKIVDIFEKNISSTPEEIYKSIWSDIEELKEDCPENVHLMQMESSIPVPEDWHTATDMPKRLTKHVDKHNPYGRMVAKAIFEQMSEQGQITDLEWRKNKKLQEQFFEEFSSAEKSGYEEALKKYVLDTDENRRALAFAKLEETGKAKSRYAVHKMYKSLEADHTFEKMLAHKKVTSLERRVEIARNEEKEENHSSTDTTKSALEQRRDNYKKQKAQTEAAKKAIMMKRSKMGGK